MARRTRVDYMAQFADNVATDELDGGAKKKARTAQPKALSKSAAAKAKPAPVAEPASQPSDYDGGRDDGSETEPCGSPELEREVTEITSALDSTLKCVLESKKSAFHAHQKTVANLRVESEKELGLIVRRNLALLDKLEGERGGKAKEAGDVLDTIMRKGVQDLSSATKAVKAVRKDCGDAREAWERENAELAEQIKSDLARALKQSLAQAAVSKKQVRDEPMLPFAASHLARVSSRG